MIESGAASSRSASAATSICTLQSWTSRCTCLFLTATWSRFMTWLGEIAPQMTWSLARAQPAMAVIGSKQLPSRKGTWGKSWSRRSLKSNESNLWGKNLKFLSHPRLYKRRRLFLSTKNMRSTVSSERTQFVSASLITWAAYQNTVSLWRPLVRYSASKTTSNSDRAL